MSQEFWGEKSQIQSPVWKKEMKEVIDLLEEYNIDFKVEGNKIMIRGDLRFADPVGVPTLVISQGDTKIGFDEYMETNRLLITQPDRHARNILLPKSIHAYYSYPYLIIHF